MYTYNNYSYCYCYEIQQEFQLTFITKIILEILVGLTLGVLSNNCIWWYFNLVKFKVLLYNLNVVYVIGGILKFKSAFNLVP